RQKLPPGSPDAFVQAQTQGNAEHNTLRPRIPTLKVLVKPDPQKLQGLQIAINDKQMPPELVGIARPINPGSYRISASATGYGTPVPANIDLPESEAKTVELTLQAGATAATTTGTAPPPVVPSPPPYDEGGKQKPREGPTAAGVLVG